MKYILAIITMAVLTISCNQDKNAQEVKVTEESNTALKTANNLFQKFNAHDWVGMAALYTDTANFKDPSLGINMVKQTRNQTIQKYTELNKIFADIKDSVVATYAVSKSTVVVEFVSKGTAPDGSSFELPICSILTINDKGLIEKDFTYYDNSSNK